MVLLENVHNAPKLHVAVIHKVARRSESFQVPVCGVETDYTGNSHFSLSNFWMKTCTVSSENLLDT